MRKKFYKYTFFFEIINILIQNIVAFDRKREEGEVHRIRDDLAPSYGLSAFYCRVSLSFLCSKYCSLYKLLTV